MNAAALALVEAEPTRADLLVAALHEIEVSLVRLLGILCRGAVA